MKKALLLLFCGVVAFCACNPDNVPGKDKDLTGQSVDVSTFPKKLKKVFLLNEGQMGTNNSTLDFIRVSDALFIKSAFQKMNPDEGAGLGDVGNDIAVNGNEVWMAINNSGIVEVISAKNEKQIAAIQVPTPRNITFDDKYAYVSSWAGAYAQSKYDSDGNYIGQDANNPKGQVYRINLSTKKIDGQPVEVGYQPEGLAIRDGKLYVANSGGISSMIGPYYVYDKTLSVIDTKSFTVTSTIDVEVNLQEVYYDGAGNIYVTSAGNYVDKHSGLYLIDGSDRVKKVLDYVSVACICGDTIYGVGEDTEFSWMGPHNWKAWSCKGGVKSDLALNLNGVNPYCIYALDGDNILIGDAGDYVNPGKLSLFNKGNKKWTVTAGVCPGHIAIW